MTRKLDPTIRLLLVAVFLLGVAYGLGLSVLPLQLEAIGMSKRGMGTLATWYASGIVLMSLPMGHILRHVSTRSAIVVCALGYATCVGVFPFLRSYLPIASARFLDGAFSIGIWVGTEVVVLSRARRHEKAHVTSLYAMAMALGYVVGPLLARGIVLFAPMKVAFFGSTAIAVGTAALVWLRLDADVTARLDGAHPSTSLESAEVSVPSPGSYRAEDPPPPSKPLGGAQILWRIKTACFATFAFGYFQASSILFLPLYMMEDKGTPRDQTIFIPAFFAVGMLLFSNLLGRLGDKVGHLRMMRTQAVVGVLAILGFAMIKWFPFLCFAIFVTGATLAALSPVSLALLGIVTAHRDYSRANATYNGFFAGGMLIGPYVSSTLFARFGGSVMVLHLAGLWLAFVVFTVLFASDDPASRRSPSPTSRPASRPSPSP